MTSRFARVPALATVALLLAAPLAAQSAPPVAVQIAGAVLPLPDSMQAGAAVLGYEGTRLVELRKGTNPMICIADDPAQEGFHTACYHRDVDPFMKRGRELREQGASRGAIDSTRLAELESGRIALPKPGTMLYSVFLKDGFDPTGGLPEGAGGLYVIYMPYATEATTGLSTLPSQSGPWLMYPGKPTAHIMIPR